MNEIFSLFYKKADGHVFTYTLLYYSGIKRLLIFVISLVTKKVHSLLAWTECTKHKQNKQF